MPVTGLKVTSADGEARRQARSSTRRTVGRRARLVEQYLHDTMARGIAEAVMLLLLLLLPSPRAWWTGTGGELEPASARPRYRIPAAASLRERASHDGRHLPPRP